MADERNWKTDGYNPEENGWWKATVGGADNNYGYPSNYLFADSIRAVVIAFGNYFNNLYVVRYDENGYPRKKIQVPIKHGPRAKSHDYRKEQESGKTYYIPQPNMTYKITSVEYDAEREASPNKIRTFYDTYLSNYGVSTKQIDLLWQDVRPSPWNLTIELAANCDKMSDAMQIMEQICARFRPDSYLYVKEFWFMNIRRDIKMTLGSVSLEYNEDYGEEDKREIAVKFSIKLDANIYTGIDSSSLIDSIYLTLNPSVPVSKQQVYSMSFKTRPSSDGKAYVYDDVASTLNVSMLSALGDSCPTELSASTFKDYFLDPMKDTEGTDCYVVKRDLVDAGIITKTMKETSAYDIYYQYEFSSAYNQTVEDPYIATIGLSGNYKPGKELSAGVYEGSLDDRWNFINKEITGRKQVLYRRNNVVQAPYRVELNDNEARE